MIAFKARAKAALSSTSHLYCDICTIPTPMPEALALGLLLAACQRAWWFICPMGLDYHPLWLLNNPEAIILFL